MKLSIIICVYNTTRDLLDACLESIFSSTLKKGDYEVLLIDDGSTEDYRDVLCKYPVRYERRERGGTLAARLFGIKAALGEYIAFADSDDTVGKNYHLPMIMHADSGYDIVFNSWAFHSENTRYLCANDDAVSGNLAKGEPLEVYFARGGRQHSYYVLWNKLYRSSVLKRAADEISLIAPPRPFSFSEDALINLYAFKNASSLSAVTTDFYFYRIHKGQTVNVSSRERLVRQIDCMSYTFGRCKAVLAQTGCKSAGLDEWIGLMARGHFANARLGGYKDVYTKIKDKYCVDSLRLPTRADGAIYEQVRLLPQNLGETENLLLAALEQGGRLKLRRPKRGSVSEQLLKGYVSVGLSVEYGRHYPPLPRERTPFMKRILFCRPVRAAGAKIFKRGSKIRAFLKRFI